MHALNSKKGFTIVELILVVVIIAIMATISVFGFSTWRSRTATTELKNALLSVATAMKAEKNVTNGYPATFPSSYSNSSTVVLEMASSSPTSYCINAFSKVIPEEQMSVSSVDTTPKAGLCSATSGSAVTIGGTIPNAPLGKDMAPPLSSWSMSGGATYNAANGITVGVNGVVRSPMIRIKGPETSAIIGGIFYATVQSPYVSHQPNGGWQARINYYGSDATTSVVNSATGTVSTLITQAISLNTWGPGITNTPASVGIGSNVYYVKLTLAGSYNGYSSSDLKVKSISLTLQ